MRSWIALPISPSRLSTHGGESGQRMASRSWLTIFLAVTAFGQQSTPPRESISDIAKETNGAIVSIVVSDKKGHPVTQGSGFLISKDGQVVTNYHVIQSAASAVIKLPDGAFFSVDGVLASDKYKDIAVIQAHGTNFKVLPLGDSDRIQVGDDVVAIGSPLSLESTVSNGIVSGIRRDDRETFLQITAPISPGSSGGPLFNMSGEVIGITTARLKSGENLNFAIPTDELKPLLAKVSKESALPVEADNGKSDKQRKPVSQMPSVAATFTCPTPEAKTACNSFQQMRAAKDTDIKNALDDDFAFVCFSPKKDRFFTVDFSIPSSVNWFPDSDTTGKPYVEDWWSGVNVSVHASGTAHVQFFEEGMSDQTLLFWSGPRDGGPWRAHAHIASSRWVIDAPDLAFYGACNDPSGSRTLCSLRIDQAEIQMDESYSGNHYLTIRRSTKKFSETVGDETVTGQCMEFRQTKKAQAKNP